MQEVHPCPKLECLHMYLYPMFIYVLKSEFTEFSQPMKPIHTCILRELIVIQHSS